MIRWKRSAEFTPTSLTFQNYYKTNAYIYTLNALKWLLACRFISSRTPAILNEGHWHTVISWLVHKRHLVSKGKSDRTNTLGFYQLEMISKEVIPTETLKWEKDALDFSILGKKKFYLVAFQQLILKQSIKAVLLKFSPTSFPWSLLFPSLLCLQGKGRREILGTRLSFHYFSQKWVGDWVNILRMGAGGGRGVSSQ